MTDELIRGLERLVGQYHITPEQMEKLRRLRELEALARPHGGIRFGNMRRIISFLHSQGQHISRTEIRMLQANRTALLNLLRGLKGNAEAARLASMLARAGRPLGLLRFVNPALFLLVLAIGIGLYFYLRQDDKATRVAQVPYCDCTHVTAGLLTKEYQEQCRKSEAALVQMADGCDQDLGCVRDKLDLQVGENGLLSQGAFCDSVTAGPAAWPVGGGPKDPPPQPPEEKPCLEVRGLSRECQ